MDKAENPAQAHYRSAVSKERDGDLEGAEEQYSLALLRDSKHGASYLARGTLRWRRRDYQKAIKDLSRAIALDDKNIQAFGVRGSCLIAQRDYVGATNDFTKALALRPNDAILLAKRAQAKFRSKDYLGAIADATRSVGQKPNGNAYYFKGLAMAAVDDDEGAEAALREAKKLGHGEAMEVLIKRYGGL